MEKRIKNLEERKCIKCGTVWKVRVKGNVKHKQLFCHECINSLTIQERQYIYRLYSGKYHEEIRTCNCCNKQWKVQVENSKIPSRVKYFCKDCNSNLTSKDKNRILRVKIEGFHDKEKTQRRESHKRNIIHNMVLRAKSRARKYGYVFELKDSDIIIPEICPLLNVPFILGNYKNYEYTPTIDRIDNSKGYTKDNIWIISKKANSMKNSATFKELKTFCTNILRYSLNNTEKECIESEDKEP